MYAELQPRAAEAGVHNIVWGWSPNAVTSSNIIDPMALKPDQIDLAGIDSYEAMQGRGEQDQQLNITGLNALAGSVPRIAVTEAGPHGSADGSWDPRVVPSTAVAQGLRPVYVLLWFDDGDGSDGYTGKKQISSLSGWHDLAEGMPRWRLPTLRLRAASAASSSRSSWRPGRVPADDLRAGGRQGHPQGDDRLGPARPGHGDRVRRRHRRAHRRRRAGRARPKAGRKVVIERNDGGSWTTLQTTATDATGRVWMPIEDVELGPSVQYRTRVLATATYTSTDWRTARLYTRRQQRRLQARVPAVIGTSAARADRRGLLPPGPARPVAEVRA